MKLKSFKTKIAIFVLFSIFLHMLGYFILSTFYLRRIIESSIKTNYERSADFVANYLLLNFEQAYEDLKDASKKVNYKLMENPETGRKKLEEFQSVMNHFNNGLYLMDEKGRIISETNVAPSRTGYDVSFREYFKKTKERKQPVIHSYISSQEHRKKSLMFTMPFLNTKNEFSGFFSASMKIDTTPFFMTIISEAEKRGFYFILSSADESNILSNIDENKVSEKEKLYKVTKKLNFYTFKIEVFGTTDQINLFKQEIEGPAWGVITVVTFMMCLFVYFLFNVYPKTLNFYTKKINEISLITPTSKKNEIDHFIDTFNKFNNYIKNKEDRFKFFTEFLPHPIFECNKDNNFVYLNLSAKDKFKLDLNQSFFNILSESEVAYAKEEIEKIYNKTKKYSSVRYDIKLPDSQNLAQVIAHTTPVIIDDKVIGFRGIFVDISEIIKVQDALIDSEEKMRIIFDSSTDGIILQEVDGTIIDANKKALSQINLEYLNFNNQKFQIEDNKNYSQYITAWKKTLKNENQTIYLDINSPTNFLQFLKISFLKVTIARKEAIITTLEDLTEQRAFQNDMLDRKKELERSNQELEQFAYVASHDLQEPLRTVSGFVKLLKEKLGDSLDQEASEYITFALQGTTRMHDLINDLLTFSRIKSVKFETQKLDLNKIMEEVLFSLRAQIEITNAIITYEPLPEIYVDKIKFAQLIQNLISNGIKFRKAETTPRVHVSIIREYNSWHFMIRDNGIGIEKKYLNKLFVIFKRLHTADKYPGTGIGLALCKKIIELHGGKIWVESEPNVGTVIHFTIPDTNSVV